MKKMIKGLLKKSIRRFEVLAYQTKGITGGCLKIMVDRNTGVHYIVGDGIAIAGITPLLDGRGKPVIAQERDYKELLLIQTQ